MALISGLEKYIGSVGKTYDRTTGVSNDTDEWKKNFADVLVDGDVGSELARTAKVIADRVAAGLDTSAQETYKAQLLEASRTINGSSGMESKESTYGSNENSKVASAAGGNWGMGDYPGYENATSGALASLGAAYGALSKYFKTAEVSGMTDAVKAEAAAESGQTAEAIAKGQSIVYYDTSSASDWTKLALIGGGALIAAAFVKGLMD